MKKSAAIKKLQYLRKKLLFTGSADYWERRYSRGRNSGQGSYGKYAEFKAAVLNNFCQENNIGSVIEFGCGDGNLLLLTKYPKYTGLDVSPTTIKNCMKLFADDKNKSFFYYDTFCFRDNARIFNADLAVSLDVLFHLVEDEVYEQYLRNLFNAADKYVIILSSNRDQGKPECVHVLNRKITDDIGKLFPEWELIKEIKNIHTENFANFYVYEKRPS